MQEENALLNQRPEPAPAPHPRKLAAAAPPPCPGVIGMLIKQFEGDPAVVVDDLTPGGPAAECGQIRVGDRLLAVDGRAVAGMALPAIHGLINGPAGRSLRLQMAQPRGDVAGAGAGSGSTTPRDRRGDALGALTSACYSIAVSGGGGGGSGANTPRRPSQDQSRVGAPADRAGGAVYEVELVRAALELPIE